MLGNAVFRVLSEAGNARVYGTVRAENAKRFFVPGLASRIIVVEDVEDYNALERLFDLVKPQVVVNCVSPGKLDTSNTMKAISIFSLLPRRLLWLCRLRSARLIQISSDGVFSGSCGGYTEDDFPDGGDVYAIAKQLGELNESHAVTLRTSIIGHELRAKTGLLEWFLSQNGQCKCYTRAIFSGFPTVVLAQVIRDVIIPRPDLHGIYHVATQPISKFDLLQLVAQRYGKSIKLIPDDSVIIDRSLSAERFAKATGYTAPAWPELIDSMYCDRYGLKGK